MFVLQVAAETLSRPSRANCKPREDFLARTEMEISMKLFDIETINCLRMGFRLEDRASYISLVELRRRVHRASLTVQSMRLLEQEMEMVTKRLEKNLLLEEELLLTAREVQAQTTEYLLSRLTG